MESGELRSQKSDNELLFMILAGEGIGEEMDQRWELEGNGDWGRGGGAAIVSPDNCQTSSEGVEFNI